MKKTTLIITTLFTGIIHAETDFQRMYDREHGEKKTETPEQIIKSHAEGSKLVAREQDELSADVQELIQGETNAKVIDFLAEAEDLMAQATDRLEEFDTSGATIAIETEIIEKIGAAAKQKQQSGEGEGEGKSGALMEMMKQMMGQGAEGKKPGDKPGKGPGGKSGGEGQEAESGTGNETGREKSDGKTETRRLPKKSGSAGTKLPREFNKALDAFNKGLNASK